MSVTETFADMNASSLLMVIRSRTFGMLCRITFSGVSSVAAITGSAEFLAPLIATVPCSALPPLIRNLSIARLLSQCLSQISLGVREFLSRFGVADSQSQHNQCDPQIVSGLTQRVFRNGQIFAAGLRENPLRAAAKLFIREHHVDHQVLVNVTQAHHRCS